MEVGVAGLYLHWVWTTHLARDFRLGGGVCQEEWTLPQKVTKTEKNNNNNSPFGKYFKKYFLMQRSVVCPEMHNFLMCLK